MLSISPAGLTTKIKTPTIHELDHKIDRCQAQSRFAIKKAQSIVDTHAFEQRFREAMSR